MRRPILHPSDFSPASLPALRTATDLAKRMRRPLLIVHVMSPVATFIGDMYVSPQVYDDLYRSMELRARKQLAALVAKARAQGARASGLLVEGPYHERILRAARARHAEMIVMGTHGRTGIKKVVLGSVAARVLAEARCPVLTVRGRSRR
jgi:nucleotide-binding universal stress UspA family protein